MPQVLWYRRPQKSDRLSTFLGFRGTYYFVPFYPYPPIGRIYGGVADVVNAVLFASLQLAILTKKLTFTKGLTFLYILAFAKLAANCILSSVFGALPDELSSISNVFLVFLLVLLALTQLMYKTALALIAGLVPMVVFYFIEHPAITSFFGMKAFFVGFMCISITRAMC